ncbi:MAG: amino acid ABC transporter permease [Clostridia bacterium]|nr:amino acid ABC transporter permease [Clostridia bacterium]MDY4083153.1 amino acid ABC transporter permease [Eubacteriales bacterium]
MSFSEVTLSMLEGTKYTLGLFFITLLIAIPFGMIIAALELSKSKIVSSITKSFVWIIRGTPLMLQLIVVMYVPGLVFGMPMRERFLAAIIAFGVNYAAYFAEIYRGGIQSIPQGQYEAGYVLGFKRKQIVSRIVIPQVFKRIMPPMSNEVITLVKDTSLANIIGIMEIIMTAKTIVSTKGIIWPLFYTGVFYLVMSGVLTLLFNYIEKKLDYYKI